MRGRILIHSENKNVRAELWINRIPISLVRPEIKMQLYLPVNQFLLKGTNKLGVLLHAGPVPSIANQPWGNDLAAATYVGPASITVTMERFGENDMPFKDHPPALATYTWSGDASTTPLWQEKEFSVPEADGGWAWERATQFPSMAAAQAGAIEYVQYLYQLLVQGNFAQFVAESSYKVDEMTKAYELAKDMRADMLQVMGMYSKPPYHLDPLNPHQIDLRLVADGRLVECQKTNRDKLLRYSKADSKDDFFLPLMIGQIDGKWKILR